MWLQSPNGIVVTTDSNCGSDGNLQLSHPALETLAQVSGDKIRQINSESWSKVNWSAQIFQKCWLTGKWTIAVQSYSTGNVWCYWEFTGIPVGPCLDFFVQRATDNELLTLTLNHTITSPLFLLIGCQVVVIASRGKALYRYFLVKQIACFDWKLFINHKWGWFSSASIK